MFYEAVGLPFGWPPAIISQKASSKIAQARAVDHTKRTEVGVPFLFRWLYLFILLVFDTPKLMVVGSLVASFPLHTRAGYENAEFLTYDINL